MDPGFWHQRWRNNQIGFHQGRINETLRDCYSRLEPRPGEHVFVPLCGKSMDLLWLREQGHPVTGVEVSPVAVAAFFQENGLRAKALRSGALTRHDSTGFTLYCGDFFDLEPIDVCRCTLAYDRASLVALPAGMRLRYARHLLRLLPEGARILLVTLRYPQEEAAGPPFSVGAAEVETLFGDHCAIDALGSRDILDQEPHLRAKGISSLHEEAYLIRPFSRP